MNDFRRCEYCSKSRLATITAPNAALRGGLIGMDGGVGTAPRRLSCDWAFTEVRSTKSEVRSKRERKKTKSAAPRRLLDVKFLGLIGALHDEPEAGRCVLSHELVDHAIGDQL